ncbi:MAG: energy-coupling factor transporter transmembrane protein EcfT [Geobacter sp.]|nr:energy-coupling factor transporter transmembrane protein EcfT [Geobacter sp.]
MGAAWKLLLGFALGGAAVVAREPLYLLLLLLLVMWYYFAARLTVFDLWQDLRFFMFQAAVVIFLYCARHGVAEGLRGGVGTSLQIILFFLPGVVLVRTTRTTDMMNGLRRVVPYRISFLVFVSLRFIPFFARELKELTAAQRLRGARISPRELMDPRNWRDLVDCLLVPLLVRALKTADEVALSAEARGFGAREERTQYIPPLPLGEGRGEGGLRRERIKEISI